MPTLAHPALQRSLAAAMLFAGAAGHATIESARAEPAETSATRPAVTISLKDRKGTIYALGRGRKLGQGRFQITAALRRPVVRGRYVLRFSSKDSRGSRSGFAYDITARPRGR